MTEKSSVIGLQHAWQGDVDEPGQQQERSACDETIERLLPSVIASSCHARIGCSLDALELFVRHCGSDDVHGVVEQLDSILILVCEPDAKYPSFFRRFGRLEYRDACTGQTIPCIFIFELTSCDKDLTHRAVW